MPPVPHMVRWRAWRFPALALGLLLALAAACGPAGAPEAAPATDMAAPDPAPAMPAPTPALLRPTPTPIVQDYPDITWQVAPSLEEQIFTSPVIVRASLQAAAAAVETVPSTPGVAPTYRPVQELRFTVHEYLKGTGPAALVVVVRGTHTFLTEAEARADAVYAVAQRVTAWDDRQGVLFLQTPAQPYTPAATSGGAAGAAGSASAPSLQFTRSNFHREQQWDYSVDMLSRAWLPARDAGGAAGQTRAADGAGTVFITDGAESPPPVVSMTDLRAKIAALAAELQAGEGIEGHTDCILTRIGHARHRRTVPWAPFQYEATLASGAAAGIEVYKGRNEYREPRYSRWWLSGPDPERFQPLIIDDDDQSSNGYDHALATARPLPAGTYRVHYNWQHYSEIPCNFVPEDTYRDWTVTVTAPAGTVHEAFFDPVALGAGVGADEVDGVLQPAAFSVGATGTTIERLVWEANEIRLELSAAIALADHYLDLIALDGSVALRLRLDDATTAPTAAGGQAWRWRACGAPWQTGDQLMLRLHHSATAPPDVAAAPGCGPPPTFGAASYAFTVAEDAVVGAAVGTVTATAAGGTAVIYTVTAGDEHGAFAIDGSTGALTVARPLDYATAASYTLTVAAQEEASAAATTSVTITVTDVDEPPIVKAAA